MTDAQQQALRWLRERNGTGVIARDGVVVAGGERAPFMRSTWNALKAAGHVTIAFKRISIAT